MLKHALIAGLLLCSSHGLVWGQNPLPARQTILLQNPARPATVKASVVSGNLVVTGYDEKEILVETTVAGHPPSSKDQARDGERNSPASDFRPAPFRQRGIAGRKPIARPARKNNGGHAERRRSANHRQNSERLH